MPPRNPRPRRPQPRIRYSADEKADALALYAEHGAAGTHALLGIPTSTLRAWASAAGVRAPANELAARFTNKKDPPIGIEEEGSPPVLQMSKDVERAEQTEGYDRAELSRMWAELAELSHRAAKKALKNNKTMDADRLNRVFGTATDKLLLLGGRPSGQEIGRSLDEMDAKITAMLTAIRIRMGMGALDANSRPSETGPAVAVEQPRVLPAAPLEHPGRIPDRPPLPQSDNPGGSLGGEAPAGPGPGFDGGPIPDGHVGDDEQGRG